MAQPQIYKPIGRRIFDYLEPKSRKLYYICFRIIKIQLSNGSAEYLYTNLPPEDFTTSEIRELYHMRLGIETSFRDIKYAAGMVFFHSRKKQLILQEIYAKLIIFNFISLLVSCVKLPSGRNTKYTYKVSFSDAISTGRLFLLNNIRSVDVIPRLEFHKTAERPDRKARRKLDSQKLKTLQHRT